MIMIDFLLSESGDLIFEERFSSDRLLLSFYIAEHPGLRLSFFGTPEQPEYSDTNFCLSFLTQTAQEQVSHGAVVLYENDALAQNIRIRIDTELSELIKRPTVGSLVQTIRHSQMYDLVNMSGLETAIKNAISPILPDAVVKVKAELGTGNFFCQNVNVYIYLGDFLFYSASL